MEKQTVNILMVENANKDIAVLTYGHATSGFIDLITILVSTFKSLVNKSRS